MSELDREFVDGYLDGLCIDTPEAGENRHPAYKHSFKVGRAEVLGKPIPAHVSRRKSKIIEENL